MDQEDIKLYVCEDGAWTLAERYAGTEAEKAIGEAKLSLRASGVSGVKLVHSKPDAAGKAKHDTIYRVVKAGAKVPPEPDPGQAAPPVARVVMTKPSGARGKPAAKSALAPPPPPPMPVKKPAAKRPRRKPIPTAQRLVMAGGAGTVAAIAGPVLMSSNVAADAMASGSGAGIYLTAIALFLAAFGTVLYVTGRIGQEPRLKPEPGGAAESDGMGGMGGGGAVSIEAVMAAAGVKADAFELNFDSDKKDEGPAPPPSEVQQLKTRLLQFLQDCLSDAVTRKHLPQGQLDPRNRFGFHLFMLGAGQACLAALPKNLQMKLADLVEQALMALGSEPEKARAFAESVQGYQKEVKNAAMIRAGYEAMSGFLKENKLSGVALARAMEMWNTVDRGDGAPPEAGQDVAIMFTDMVGSVETTQQYGDDGMMKLVDQHNLIVGAVLKMHRGHQVKHTGDGVMAVFPRVADGVTAAVEIQRQIADFNSVTQGAQLKVRIGLSAGNPIRKDDDYFGTVVQTAARVCPVAGTGEIAMPDAVAKLPGCDRFTYSEPIAVPLKGFAEPQLVRKLLWGGPRAAAAPAATPAPAAAPPAEAPAEAAETAPVG